MQNWNFRIERTVPGNVLVTAPYVGNKGTRMPSSLENLDQVDPCYLSLGSTLLADINSPAAITAGIKSPYPGFSGSVAQALRPYPQFPSITNSFEAIGASSYNSLRLSAQRRFSDRLQFLVSYVASKSLGNTDEGFSTSNAAPVNTYNRKAEWALQPTDTPQAFKLATVYQLPIGPGKRVLQRGLASKVLGGWQVGLIDTYHSGTPVSVSAANVLPFFGGGNRPNIVPGVNPQLNRGNFDPPVNKVYNAAAFSQPADYTFGNAPGVQSHPRNFPIADTDFNLLKRTRSPEICGC